MKLTALQIRGLAVCSNACEAADLGDFLRQLGRGELYALHLYLEGHSSGTSITGQLLAQVIFEGSDRYFQEVQP